VKTVLTSAVVILIFSPVLYFVEQQRLSSRELKRISSSEVRQSFATQTLIRAPGRVQGRTEDVKLRARVFEQISDIPVVKGQLVFKGDVLVRLDDRRLSHERDLAAAMLVVAVAAQAKLENGYRDSEIETLRQEYEATLGRLDRIEKIHARGIRLVEYNAISEQNFEELSAELSVARAMASAAKGRLLTLQQPAREDDLRAASGSVTAAELRLKIAQLNLDHAQITAPVDGCVLSIDAEIGELTGPESPEPLVVMANTKQLRVVAEIDEFDALKVNLGQACDITSDATQGLLARGQVTTIEPRMRPKKMFGKWAGERMDTSTIRVWIDLSEHRALPVGLPVEVLLNVKSN